ncbi:MFS general substrate transporter [Tilletiaria anomala UBC 951]|uniref:MFS general substrate transporter n=1 Tax=Tilletiaria anomala (strain ATCC 24038 / CBS 436.72 / UBC 951) TaxID=1037660 RepID=A0A066W9J6_TILAU|nr:MFS general substrate transporter [Tilletiaria anomala UBC 951]KDN47749.1 MFS general substrate transporter [Tilletiaria anomala UBC 951]
MLSGVTGVPVHSGGVHPEYASTSHEATDDGKQDLTMTLNAVRTSNDFPVAERRKGSDDDGEAPWVSPLTPEQERKVQWKVDMALIPWLSFLYLLSFLDRSAIGNAKLYGLEKSIGLTPTQYNICLTVFFIPYALFEIPSNVLLKRLKPSIWFPSITIAVGICMLSQGVVKNYGGLVAARVSLAIAEAGLFPGVNFLLSGWYTRSQFGIRAAIFFSAASVAGAFGGLLSVAIVKMDGVGGYEGWRWIFIIIGLITFVAGVASFILVPDFPADSKFLKEDERAYLIGRLQNDQQYSAKGEHFSWVNVAKGFLDWKMWVGGLVYAGCDGPLYAFSLFTPTIVKATFVGSSGTKANLLSVPIYVLACLQVLAVGFFTARYGHRALINIIMMCIGAVGYIILLASNNNALSYFAIYIAATGIYCTIPNTIALTSASIEGTFKKSVVMGYIISFGNLNGAVTSGAIYKAKDAPHYRLGHGIVLLYICIGIISTGVYWWCVSRENRLRDEGARNEKILSSSIAREERQELADKAHEERLHAIRDGDSNGLVKQFHLLLARTHSLPGGTYASVADAKAKKGDDWSGHRYST